MSRIIQVIKKRTKSDSVGTLCCALPTVDDAKAELRRLVSQTGPYGFSHLAIHIGGLEAWRTLSDAHPELEIEEVTLFDGGIAETARGYSQAPAGFPDLLRQYGLDTDFSAQFMGLALFTRGWSPQFAVDQLYKWSRGVRSGEIHDETIKLMAILREPAFP